MNTEGTQQDQQERQRSLEISNKILKILTDEYLQILKEKGKQYYQQSSY